MNGYRPTGWNSRALAPRSEPGTHRDRLTDLLCGPMIFPVSASNAADIPSYSALPADGKSDAISRPGKRPGPARRRS